PAGTANVAADTIVRLAAGSSASVYGSSMKSWLPVLLSVIWPLTEKNLPAALKMPAFLIRVRPVPDSTSQTSRIVVPIHTDEPDPVKPLTATSSRVAERPFPILTPIPPATAAWPRLSDPQIVMFRTAGDQSPEIWLESRKV